LIYEVLPQMLINLHIHDVAEKYLRESYLQALYGALDAEPGTAAGGELAIAFIDEWLLW